MWVGVLSFRGSLVGGVDFNSLIFEGVSDCLGCFGGLVFGGDSGGFCFVEDSLTCSCGGFNI